MTYPIEKIPGEDKLFRRVSPKQFKKNSISSAAFETFDLSVDWEKYSTPQQTLDSANIKDKSNWRVVSIKAEIPRILGQQVNHDPTLNRAHSLVLGEKSFQISSTLADASILEI